MVVGCGKDDEPTCRAMAEHVNKLLGEDAEARALQKTFEQRCLDDRWSQGMRQCVMRTTSTESSQSCRIYLNDKQQQRWDAAVAQVAAATSRELPDSCLAYVGMVERAQACEALSKEVRGELATRLRAHQAEWAKLDDKSGLAERCGSAISALRGAAPSCFK